MANSQSKVEQWLDDLEGYQLPTDDGTYRCDYCSTPMGEGTHVTHYLADKILNPEWVSMEGAAFAVLRTYCDDCNRTEIQYPCAGFNELIISSDMDSEGRNWNFEVEDVSKSSDGSDWDPKEVWEAVYSILMPGVTWESWVAMNMMDNESERHANNPMGLGPEDVVDALGAWQIHMDEIIDEDGNVSLTEEEKEHLEAHMEKRAEELHGADGNQDEWSETVTRGRNL